MNHSSNSRVGSHPFVSHSALGFAPSSLITIAFSRLPNFVYRATCFQCAKEGQWPTSRKEMSISGLRENIEERYFSGLAAGILTNITPSQADDRIATYQKPRRRNCRTAHMARWIPPWTEPSVEPNRGIVRCAGRSLDVPYTYRLGPSHCLKN